MLDAKKGLDAVKGNYLHEKFDKVENKKHQSYVSTTYRTS